MNETQESAIADFLQILEEHRKNCEQQGKYVEAEGELRLNVMVTTTTMMDDTLKSMIANTFCASQWRRNDSRS
jgi:hypothetical protein